MLSRCHKSSMIAAVNQWNIMQSCIFHDLRATVGCGRIRTSCRPSTSPYRKWKPSSASLNGNLLQRIANMHRYITAHSYIFYIYLASGVDLVGACSLIRRRLRNLRKKMLANESGAFVHPHYIYRYVCT